MMGAWNKLSPLIVNKEQFSSRSRSITFLSRLFLLHCSHVLQGGDGNPFVCLYKQLGWLIINSALRPLYEGTEREKKDTRRNNQRNIPIFFDSSFAFILPQEKCRENVLSVGHYLIWSGHYHETLHLLPGPFPNHFCEYNLALPSLILSNFLQNTCVPSSLKKAMFKSLLKEIQKRNGCHI